MYLRAAKYLERNSICFRNNTRPEKEANHHKKNSGTELIQLTSATMKIFLPSNVVHNIKKNLFLRPLSCQVEQERPAHLFIPCRQRLPGSYCDGLITLLPKVTRSASLSLSPSLFYHMPKFTARNR